jgi:steroid delta-isomerase-like uncharacterized protein
LTAAELKERFLYYFEEIFNKRNLAATEQAFAPNLVFHSPIRPEAMRGTEELKQWAVRLSTGFPDIHIVIDDIVAEGETIVARWSWQGTHRGPFEGIPPTGKRVSAHAIEIYRFAGDRIEEVWLELNPMDLLQQLGVMPPLDSMPRPLLWLMSRLSRRRARRQARSAA